MHPWYSGSDTRSLLARPRSSPLDRVPILRSAYARRIPSLDLTTGSGLTTARGLTTGSGLTAGSCLTIGPYFKIRSSLTTLQV